MFHLADLTHTADACVDKLVLNSYDFAWNIMD